MSQTKTILLHPFTSNGEVDPNTNLYPYTTASNVSTLSGSNVEAELDAISSQVVPAPSTNGSALVSLDSNWVPTDGYAYTTRQLPRYSQMTWDGDTTDLDSITYTSSGILHTYYKISDTVLGAATFDLEHDAIEVAASTGAYTLSGHSSSVEDDLLIVSNNSGVVFIISGAAGAHGAITLPSSGTYVLEFSPIDYVKEITSQATLTVRTFDEKYIPSNILYSLPNEDNTTGIMKFVVCEEEPTTKYNGFMYIVLGE